MRPLVTQYQRGVKAAFAKFALGPPTQVDQFMADVEQGKDVAPMPALPPMDHGGQMGQPMEHPPALDGTTALSTSPPTPPDTIGSTTGMAPPPPQNMGMLGG